MSFRNLTVLLAAAAVLAAPGSSTIPGIFKSPPFLGGVNTAGYDFSVDTSGTFTGTGVDPPVAQYQHFASEGANIFRIPFAWQLMTPTLGGPINETFFARYDAAVQAALKASTKPYVIVDVHNYARWDGGIIGQGGPTNEQFTSLWFQLARKYRSNSKIIFGIMNEPHDLNSIPDWVHTVQLAVNAIRSAGAVSQILLLPGSSWSSAQAFPTEAGPLLVKVSDPIGHNNLLLFDVHKYLDSDNSGTHPDCVTDNVDILTTLVEFLKDNGNRRAILSETGGGSTESCETLLKSELAFVKGNSDTLAGFAVWAAGAFDTTYILTQTPFANGTDQPIWTDAVLPNLP